jgi:hypothetical protein
MKLDLNKPYGEVYGEATHRYEQGGKRFDINQNLVEEPAAEVPAAPAVEAEPKPAKAGKKAAAPAPEADQVSAQLAG